MILTMQDQRVKITREMVHRIFKPSDYRLRVERISNAKSNGIKIVTNSTDLDKIRSHAGLARAELKVNAKLNPRLIL